MRYRDVGRVLHRSRRRVTIAGNKRAHARDALFPIRMPLFYLDFSKC